MAFAAALAFHGTLAFSVDESRAGDTGGGRPAAPTRLAAEVATMRGVPGSIAVKDLVVRARCTAIDPDGEGAGGKLKNACSFSFLPSFEQRFLHPQAPGILQKFSDAQQIF